MWPQKDEEQATGSRQAAGIPNSRTQQPISVGSGGWLQVIAFPAMHYGLQIGAAVLSAPMVYISKFQSEKMELVGD